MPGCINKCRVYNRFSVRRLLAAESRKVDMFYMLVVKRPMDSRSDKLNHSIPCLVATLVTLHLQYPDSEKITGVVSNVLFSTAKLKM